MGKGMHYLIWSKLTKAQVILNLTEFNNSCVQEWGRRWVGGDGGGLSFIFEGKGSIIFLASYHWSGGKTDTKCQILTSNSEMLNSMGPKGDVTQSCLQSHLHTTYVYCYWHIQHVCTCRQRRTRERINSPTGSFKNMWRKKGVKI